MTTPAIPSDYHLLITSSDKVSTWDKSGLQTVLSSSKSGIVAACEPHGASGFLAVADQHVVVMHDTRLQQPHSWGFNAGKECVRRLEFARDGRTLFFSSELQNDIQQYSVERDRLTAPIHALRAEPTTWAISPTAHLIVSATHEPPSIHIKNLAHNTSPILLQPAASDSVVTAIAFHPERPDVFLLGFEDSTLAAYDATRLPRGNAGNYADQEAARQAEIGRVLHVHKISRNTGVSSVQKSRLDPIGAAEFLPGYKARAVSVGADGRCRIADFTRGGKILLTWHAGAPLNTVAVLACNNLVREEAHANAKVAAMSKRTNYRIAVGRIDGKVHIYDSTGNLLAAKVVNVESTRVLGIQWVSGSGPSPIDVKGASCEEDASDLTLLTSPRLMLQSNAKHVPQAPETEPLSHEEVLGMNSSAYSGNGKNYEKPVSKNEFLDLFSPIKSSSQPIPPSNDRQPKSSILPIRPRVSSQTFQKVAQVDFVLQGDKTSTNPSSCHAEAYHFDDPDGKEELTCTPTPQVICKSSAVEHFAKERTTIDLPIVSANAAILADLRRLGAASPVHTSAAVVSATSTGVADGGRTLQTRRSNVHRQDNCRSSGNLPIDQNAQGQRKEHDIWLTSDSETEHPIAQRHRRVGRTSRSTARYVQGASRNRKDPTPSSESVANEFCPCSSKVRELFPRSSSIARGHKQESKARRNNLPSRVSSNFKSSAADALIHRGRGLNTARESAALAPVHSTELVSDGRISGQDSESMTASCEGCAEKSVKLMKLEAEVIRLKGELVLLKTILRRNGHKISYDP